MRHELIDVRHAIRLGRRELRDFNRLVDLRCPQEALPHLEGALGHFGEALGQYRVKLKELEDDTSE